MSIKYRTGQGTSASDFSDLVVKVGDTLPIGTEVDYDGQSVPAGWQEVEETNLGDVVVDSIRTKNMFDGVVANAYIDTQGVLQNASDWEASLNYIPVKQNTEYIVTASNMGARFIYAEYDSNRTVIETRKEITPATPFTTSSTTKYVRFCTNNANATNIQLEEGSTATPYTPYQELNNQEVYSTTEKRIGTWIDGKPLYRKVIVYHPNSRIGAANTVTNISIPHNISNFGQIVKRSMVDETGFCFPTVASSNGTTVTASSALMRVDSSGITFRIINDTWGARDFYITLEYTKTTD